jgi:hypothetical protein
MTMSSKVNRQGHVFVSNIFHILDHENVRIHTKMFATGDMKGHVFDLDCQGQVTDFVFSEILDIVNVGIDTEIKSAS